MPKPRRRASGGGRVNGTRLIRSRSTTIDSVLLQPWFLPKRAAEAIHAIVPHAFWNKMRHFFQDYGCMICESESGYGANGMCLNCYVKVRRRLAASVRRRMKSRKVQRVRRIDVVLLRQERLAKNLLKQFTGLYPSGSRKLSLRFPPPYNPVYETLLPHFK